MFLWIRWVPVVFQDVVKIHTISQLEQKQHDHQRKMKRWKNCICHNILKGPLMYCTHPSRWSLFSKKFHPLLFGQTFEGQLRMHKLITISISSSILPQRAVAWVLLPAVISFSISMTSWFSMDSPWRSIWDYRAQDNTESRTARATAQSHWKRTSSARQQHILTK